MNVFLKKWSILLSVLIFLGGAASAIFGFAGIRSKVGVLSTNRLLAARIQDFEDQLEMIDDAKSAIDEMDSRTPSDLDVTLRQVALLEKVSESRDGVKSLGEGWSAISREISLGDVLLSDVDRFLLEAQALRPPWVLLGIAIRSSPFESGRGQVVLTMQALRGKQK